MNLLDAILEEITKECEKERNNHQDYASQEDLKNEFNKKVQPKQNNFNNTFHINLNDMIKTTDKEQNHQVTFKMDKDNRKKVVMDFRKLNKGDIIRIVDGDYKELSNKEFKFLNYIESMDKIFIQTDKINRLYVNSKDVELVRKAKEKYETTVFNQIENRYENIIVEIENDILTVTLQDGTKSKKQLKGENKEKIMKISYYDAKIKQYLKERKEVVRC